MKKILSVILACCLVSACGRGYQEPPLKKEIENPEPPAEEQQKADAPFLSLNKTGTAILAVSVISIIGVLAWKLILARRKITADKEIYKERDRQFEDMKIENEELTKRPTPEAMGRLQSQLGKANEDITNLQGQLGIKQGELEEKEQEVAGLLKSREDREKQFQDKQAEWRQALEIAARDLRDVELDRNMQLRFVEDADIQIKKLESSLGIAVSEKNKVRKELASERSRRINLEEANRQIGNEAKKMFNELTQLSMESKKGIEDHKKAEVEFFTEVEKLVNELKERKAKKKELKMQLKIVRETVDGLSEELDRMTEENEQLKRNNEALDRVSKEFDKLRENYNRLEASYFAANAKKIRKGDKIGRLRTQLTDAEAEIDTLTKRLANKEWLPLPPNKSEEEIVEKRSDAESLPIVFEKEPPVTIENLEGGKHSEEEEEEDF